MEGGSQRAANAMDKDQDESDMKWISGEQQHVRAFSDGLIADRWGLLWSQEESAPHPSQARHGQEGISVEPPGRLVSALPQVLAENNTFLSAFGSRGLPFQLPSTEFMPPSSSEARSLAVTDKDLKYIVLVLMQETLYTGMLQDWEHLLGGGASLNLVQETLSILSVAQDLSQSDLKSILRVKERGLSEAWKRIWATLHESLGCTSKNLLGFAQSALRLAVERRYILSSEHRAQVQSRLAQHMGSKAGQVFTQELGGDWAKLRMYLSRSLASLEEGFAREALKPEQVDKGPDEPTGVIKSCIIIARFLGDSGQFREADILFDRARILAIKGGNKHFCAEVPEHLTWSDLAHRLLQVSLYCAELLNKWSSSDPAYSVDTMARSAEYASEAAQLYESLDIANDIPTQEKFSQVRGGAERVDELTAAGRRSTGRGSTTRRSVGWEEPSAREALDKCLSVRKAIKAAPAKIAEVQFARGVLTFCMAEALAAGHIFKGTPNKDEAVHGLYAEALQLFQDVYEDWRSRLGETSLETVKAITMLGTVSSKLKGPEAAIEWSKKEVQIREEVQGKLHPRTQQARRNYGHLLEQLSGKGKPKGDESSGGKSEGGKVETQAGVAQAGTKVKSEGGEQGQAGAMSALMAAIERENDKSNHKEKPTSAAPAGHGDSADGEQGAKEETMQAAEGTSATKRKLESDDEDSEAKREKRRRSDSESVADSEAKKGSESKKEDEQASEDSEDGNGGLEIDDEEEEEKSEEKKAEGTKEVPSEPEKEAKDDQKESSSDQS
eukprot:758857-Hanusia_phi.AAC.6